MNRSVGVGAVAAVAATVILASPGVAAAQGSGSLSAQDKTWMSQNAQTNLAEIAGGTLAEQRATSAQTRTLGKELVSDHTTAMAKLTALAKQENVSLPAKPNAMQLSQAQRLKTLSGAAFNTAFDEAQVKGHELSIANTKKELSEGSNAAVKARARAYLPVAEMHLANARKALATSQMQQVPSGGVATGAGGTAGLEDVGLLAGGGAALVAGGLLATGCAARSRRRRRTATEVA